MSDEKSEYNPAAQELCLKIEHNIYTPLDQLPLIEDCAECKVERLQRQVKDLEKSKVTEYQHKSLQTDFRIATKIIDKQQTEIESLKNELSSLKAVNEYLQNIKRREDDAISNN